MDIEQSELPGGAVIVVGPPSRTAFDRARLTVSTPALPEGTVPAQITFTPHGADPRYVVPEDKLIEFGGLTEDDIKAQVIEFALDHGVRSTVDPEQAGATMLMTRNRVLAEDVKPVPANTEGIDYPPVDSNLAPQVRLTNLPPHVAAWMHAHMLAGSHDWTLITWRALPNGKVWTDSLLSLADPQLETDTLVTGAESTAAVWVARRVGGVYRLRMINDPSEEQIPEADPVPQS